jgi:hypothetical protein
MKLHVAALSVVALIPVAFQLGFEELAVNYKPIIGKREDEESGGVLSTYDQQEAMPSLFKVPSNNETAEYILFRDKSFSDIVKYACCTLCAKIPGRPDLYSVEEARSIAFTNQATRYMGSFFKSFPN